MSSLNPRAQSDDFILIDQPFFYFQKIEGVLSIWYNDDQCVHTSVLALLTLAVLSLLPYLLVFG